MNSKVMVFRSTRFVCVCVCVRLIPLKKKAFAKASWILSYARERWLELSPNEFENSLCLELRHVGLSNFFHRLWEWMETLLVVLRVIPNLTGKICTLVAAARCFLLFFSWIKKNRSCYKFQGNSTKGCIIYLLGFVYLFYLFEGKKVCACVCVWGGWRQFSLDLWATLRATGEKILKFRCWWVWTYKCEFES